MDKIDPKICPHCNGDVDYLNHKHHLYLHCIMDMKSNIENKREQIRILEDEIKSIQDSCTHPETFEEERYWRVGASCNYKICKDCDKIIMNLDIIPEFTVTSTND